MSTGRPVRKHVVLQDNDHYTMALAERNTTRWLEEQKCLACWRYGKTEMFYWPSRILGRECWYCKLWCADVNVGLTGTLHKQNLSFLAKLALGLPLRRFSLEYITKPEADQSMLVYFEWGRKPLQRNQQNCIITLYVHYNARSSTRGSCQTATASINPYINCNNNGE